MMKYLVLFLAILVSNAQVRAEQGADDPCHLGTSLKKLVSDNAYLKNPPAANNFRTWKDYQKNLAIQWSDFFFPTTLIDLGAGQGIAVKGAIESGQFKNAIAIDFTDHSSAKHWEYSSEKILSKVRFEEDSAELALLRYPNQADVIVDNYGAFTYSPARVHLLNSAYRSLKPGGIAYFRIPPVSFVRISNRLIPLEDYLSHTHPRIFSVRKNGSIIENREIDPYVSAEKVLVMRKPKSGELLDLKLEISSHTKWSLPHYTRIEFPFLVFVEK